VSYTHFALRDLHPYNTLLQERTIGVAATAQSLAGYAVRCIESAVSLMSRYKICFSVRSAVTRWWGEPRHLLNDTANGVFDCWKQGRLHTMKQMLLEKIEGCFFLGGGELGW